MLWVDGTPRYELNSLSSFLRCTLKKRHDCPRECFDDRSSVNFLLTLIPALGSAQCYVKQESYMGPCIQVDLDDVLRQGPTEGCNDEDPVTVVNIHFSPSLPIKLDWNAPTHTTVDLINDEIINHLLIKCVYATSQVAKNIYF